eukprot:CAMPEP_0114492906 /NCGR_PEP_ID=MMETSP0109-20121206/3818_1 /TAXON_ID=29199 /ORGANISM="Chlorarachnion reptans, Strain CCCM449" /LENGTH=328 /DNA_ID=CAMNT_0001669807 /DNA_START=45 /DNA_END=1031 /DNA_ORIENTATION=+
MEYKQKGENSEASRHDAKTSPGFAPLFDRVVFLGGKLDAEHPFSFEKAIEDRYAMPTVTMRAHRTIEYHRLCTGGFNRVCTERCRVYWLAQNAHGHRTPDWKLHFSINKDKENLALAWNILCALFLDHACDFGIKVCVAEALGDGTWPESQNGREITLYMFKHSDTYDRGSGGLDMSNMSERKTVGGPMADLAPENELHKYWLSADYERSGSFWRALVVEAERRLRFYGVRYAGCANGDLPLGRYTSIRNEAFVFPPDAPIGECKISKEKSFGTTKNEQDQDKKSKKYDDTPIKCTRMAVYPPNYSGWNAAGQAVPGIISDSWNRRGF